MSKAKEEYYKRLNDSRNNSTDKKEFYLWDCSDIYIKELEEQNNKKDEYIKKLEQKCKPKYNKWNDRTR